MSLRVDFPRIRRPVSVLFRLELLHSFFRRTFERSGAEIAAVMPRDWRAMEAMLTATIRPMDCAIFAREDDRDGKAKPV